MIGRWVEICQLLFFLTILSEKETMRGTINELRMEISTLKSELCDMTSSNRKLSEKLDLLSNTQTSSQSSSTSEASSESADKSQLQIEQLRSQVWRFRMLCHIHTPPPPTAVSCSND